MQWQPKFITNLETSGNLSKCFVCIGSIFQIGYILYCNERKQESLWSFIIFATKPEVIFLLWQNLKWHIMPFENMKKIPFAMGKKLSAEYSQILFGGFHLHLSKLAFICQFHSSSIRIVCY